MNNEFNVKLHKKFKNGVCLWNLNDNNSIIHQSFRKTKVLALKKKLDEGIIDVDDLNYFNFIESNIDSWESEL